MGTARRTTIHDRASLWPPDKLLLRVLPLAALLTRRHTALFETSLSRPKSLDHQ